eukprot:10746148-Alexandrium_andersonii.AAC.1
MGGRGPGSPSGPNGLLRVSESAKKHGAPMFRGGRLRRRASRGASSAQICKRGLLCLQIPSRGEGGVARWEGWDRDLPLR